MAHPKKYFVLYDNLCLFCGMARKIITRLDWLSLIQTVPLYNLEELLNAQLPIPPQEALLRELHLIDSSGTVLKGFYACRKIGTLLPLTFPVALLLYLPGISFVGERVYFYVAKVKK